MRKFLLLLSGCLLTCCVGCTRSAQGSAQRFIPITHQPENLKGEPWAGSYALDTWTGQLCVSFDPVAFSEVSALPTCLELYKNYPNHH
jgi:hypothetical protein